MESSIIKEFVNAKQEEWISIRRHLHAHPELSFQEHQTALFIKEKLEALGIDNIKSEVAGTGLVVDIEGDASDLPWVLLRADMDALPIQEKNEAVYKSKIEGVMHACGHDVHSTVVLGTVETLLQFKKMLAYNIRVIFQPGEELLPGGASLMIKEGILSDKPFVKAFALHVFPDLMVGKVGFREGMYMASCDEIYIDIIGKGGHGAMPHKLIDPVLLGSQLIMSLQQLISRKCPPDIPSVLSFGKFIANGATNVIPNEVHIAGTFRTYDEEWRNEAHSFITKHAEILSQSVGAVAKVDIRKGYPLLANDPMVTKELKTHAISLLGEENVIDLSLRPTGEDFSFIAQKVPSCFFRLGTGSPNVKENFGVHHPRFDVDEKAIGIGVYLFSSFFLKK